MKIEKHFIDVMRHHTTNGEYPVAHYLRSEQALHVMREFEDHPKIRAWEAHILLDRGLQVCRYYPHTGAWWCDYYIDLIESADRGDFIEVRDLFLDIAVGHDRSLHVIDTDELFGAARAGSIDGRQLEYAVTNAHWLLNELGRHGNDVAAAMAGNGVSLTWLGANSKSD
jgi:predicted RNA-binding protein associated with RNAse of E/G family